ncbi:hypothetical protein QYH69_33965 [Paraburkholderia sp. SARCC-3016]|uniref:hypothetical protein n=1 Tax=Paraburkholderia sp. SARCC-3016 TaxID=3058611 RepID=UPI00280871BD|nr:hypothetical protein [Paraburkholderia sp. SARCC-3016]MDQ7982232.1 hypothetical protein [Paraburkholderia sp. SARCC-3016]
MPRAIYSSDATRKTEDFVDGLRATQKGPTFDSASAEEFVAGATNESGREIPKSLGMIFDQIEKKDEGTLIKGILDGCASFERQHGVAPTADVIEWALHQGYATTDQGRKKDGTLDSATSVHGDPLSLQPNRAVIAITAAIAEAIPVANYLPTDIGSNEARLIIVSHTAGQAYGQYKANDNMDGINSGGMYASAQRVHTLTLETAGANSGSYDGLLTTIQTDSEHCDQTAPAATLLRNRLIGYVNGMPAFSEVPQDGTPATGNLVGSVTIGGTTYNLTGTITYATGAVVVTPSAPLPANTTVIVEDFMDYEIAPDLVPYVNTNATTFKLYASPWRVLTQQSVDSRTQFANELGLDPAAESLMAVRNQAANERHYNVLLKAMRIASRLTPYTFDFSWTSFGEQKTRAQIWQDFSAVLGAADQDMANNTIDHGITHMYVPTNVMAQIIALPLELFVPSGIVAKPGIYRLGRLFGKYEVYYAPKVVAGAAGSPTAQILCIGRSTQVARCPFVLGDAVPPTVIPTAFTKQFVSGNAYYARSFTSVNPHGPSALGVALITVSNLF